MITVKELVLASHNPGKIREYKNLLSPYGIEVVSAADLNIVEPEETGETFLENAILKARHVAQISGKPALSDDSGFVMEALDYFPGVASARYAKTFSSLAACYFDLNEKLASKPNKNAYFECVICYCTPENHHQEFVGRIDGEFVYPPRGNDGFGFDFVFQPQGYDKTFAEMGQLAKNKISHRAQALEKFINLCLSRN